MGYNVPFYVKHTKPGRSFYDLQSKLKVVGDNIVKVTELTPQTQQRIQNGALKVVEQDGEAVSNKPVADKGKTAPSKPTPATDTTAKSSTPASADKGADKAEPGLEDLLNGPEETGAQGKTPAKSGK